jgi:hypothetical protein
MIRTIVTVLDMALGVAAVAGGAYALAGGGRVWPDWLRGTPFKTPVWPALTLLVLCGGSLLTAAALLLADAHLGRLVSVEAGVVLAGWSGMMLSASSYRRWVQALPLLLGVAVVVLSFALPAPG